MIELTKSEAATVLALERARGGYIRYHELAKVALGHGATTWTMREAAAANARVHVCAIRRKAGAKVIESRHGLGARLAMRFEWVEADHRGGERRKARAS